MRFSHPLSKFGAGSASPFHFCAPQELPAGGGAHGRTERKKLGGRKEICPTFSDCARVVKKNFPDKN